MYSVAYLTFLKKGTRKFANYTKGKTSLIKGFRSREGKPFDAYLTFDKDFRTVYGFPPRTDKPKGKERRR